MATRILIAGAPTGCWSNAGDEAVLLAMARHLREAVPGAELTVASSSPPGTLRALGVGEVPYSDIARLFEAARASDLLVLGGGGVFFDYWGFDPAAVLTPRHEGLSFYGGFGVLARLVGRPLMIYGAGVGPVQGDAAREFTRDVFAQAAAATVRDQQSLRALAELGADTTRVRVTADPVFAWSPDAEPPAALAGLPRPLIGVAMREWESAGAGWEAAVADALAALRARHGGTLVFVPLHRTVDWPLTDDHGVAERVRAASGGHGTVLPPDMSAPEKAAALRACDLVLAMRMHAAVFAAGAGVPAVGLAYDPKVQGAFDALGAGEWCVPLAQVERLGDLLSRALAARADLGARLRPAAEGLAQAARENASLAAALLASRPAAAAEAQVAELRAELARIRGSRGWRLLQALWNVRRRVAPPGGRVERWLGFPHTAPAPADAQPAPAPVADAEGQRALADAIAGARRSPDVSAVPEPRAIAGRPRRVALLTNRLLDWSTREPRFGGAERYVVALGRLLRELGFDVSFYQAATGAAFEGEYFGFPVTALPRGGHHAEFEHGVGEAFHEATGGHDHVLYAMPNYGSGPMREDALLVCHGIWFDHDLLPPPYTFRTPEWFEHLYRVFSRPRLVVSVDTNSINVVRALWPEVATRLTYLPNAVDTRVFKPPVSRPGPQTVLFPRRMDVIRGSRILGDVLARIPHRWRMRWVGDGDGQEPGLVRAVAERDPRLELCAASFDEMPAIYQQADICVIPSVASEGTSLSCLEGLASGCAVVATNVGGLPDLVQPGVNGLLVDPEPGAIADAITFLIEHGQERARLQRAARETAHAFRQELWEQRWTALLERLGWLSGARALPRAGAL